MAWNKGDAVGYSRNFAAASCTFTNIRGQFFTGYPGYLKQHEVIFQGIYKNSTLNAESSSRCNSYGRMSPSSRQSPPSPARHESPVGVTRDDKGRIRHGSSRVVTKEAGCLEDRRVSQRLRETRNPVS